MKLTQRLAIGYIQTKFKVIAAISKRKAAEKAFELFCTPYLKSKAKTTPVFENSTPLNFTLNGLKVKGWQWNHPGTKKILILHGFGSAAHHFQHFVKPLVSKGYEVLAFDAPAHGASEGKTINAVIYGETIKKIIELYGPVDGFITHSFGGIALCLALENVKHAKDTRIVFIAPATETTTAVDQAFTMLKLNDPEVQKEFHKIIFEVSGKPLAWFSIRRALKNIQASILWVHDEDDDITPLSDALKVKEDPHHNIDFQITKGLGHKKIYRDVAVKNKVVNFL